MESPASKSSTVRTVELPPRRGRVKREIFGGLANSIVSAAVTAGGAFQRKVRGGGGGGSSSSTATPPTSGYTSDQNSEST
ncbi:hypothetical protein EUTSA_v10017810mg [Eutrema salsugineum]|uniref:Uncharacterized protein n=1 Tax=Eutrema salsugineum TaxID=72664 RepID=V4LL99_EUTSA|nr:uncharacterized protein LOC18028062 [Eutrema salsugineum]ESQ51340.1 hypothetical protein EUTSA_v10017810mg [Eutrema salsugineum]